MRVQRLYRVAGLALLAVCGTLLSGSGWARAGGGELQIADLGLLEYGRMQPFEGAAQELTIKLALDERSWRAHGLDEVRLLRKSGPAYFWLTIRAFRLAGARGSRHCRSISAHYSLSPSARSWIAVTTPWPSSSVSRTSGWSVPLSEGKCDSRLTGRSMVGFGGGNVRPA